MLSFFISDLTGFRVLNHSPEILRAETSQIAQLRGWGGRRAHPLQFCPRQVLAVVIAKLFFSPLSNLWFIGFVSCLGCVVSVPIRSSHGLRGQKSSPPEWNSRSVVSA